MISERGRGKKKICTIEAAEALYQEIEQTETKAMHLHD